MYDVAGVGASSVDFVYVLPAYPAPEGPLSKLQIQSHFVSCGGQTATAMAGCASLGLRAVFLGGTGNDAHGARVRQELTRRGVDISHAAVFGGPQPYAVILLTDGRGERIVLWHREEIDPSPFSVAAIQQSRLLHVDDTDVDVAIAAARVARAAERLVTTDVDRADQRTKELIGIATHPILAEHVPAAITGEPDLERAMRLLAQATAGPLIVTRGARGAIALADGAVLDVPGFSVDAIDTTGAGDVFRAGFIAAILEQRPLGEAMRFANAAAADSCTKRGAIDSVPSRAEVDKRLSSRQLAV
jgi:sugar/nucleoside kinase (ribokinase family)